MTGVFGRLGVRFAREEDDRARGGKQFDGEMTGRRR